MSTAWKTVMIAVVALAALWTGQATAQPPGPHGFRGRGDGLPLVLRTANLTDAQKGQVRQIMAGHRDQFRALRMQLRTARQQLEDQLYGPNPVTAAALAPLTDQINQLRAQLAQLAVQVALEVRGVLTPEQLAKASAVRQQMNQLRSQMRSLVGPTQ